MPRITAANDLRYEYINKGVHSEFIYIGSVTLAPITMQIDIATTIVLLARYDSRQHFAGVVTCLLCK